jgi:hypothetical protein
MSRANYPSCDFGPPDAGALGNDLSQFRQSNSGLGRRRGVHRMVRIHGRIVVILAALAVSGACQSHPVSPQQRTFLALADDSAGRVRGPYCQRNGSRDWRRGFRVPTMCEGYYRDGDAQWDRRADGTVTRAGRSWILWPEDSARWVGLRDSVTAALAALAGGTAPCVTDQPYGNGGRLTAWALADYDVGVTRFERVPGGPPGYRLWAYVLLGHAVCEGARGPAA